MGTYILVKGCHKMITCSVIGPWVVRGWTCPRASKVIEASEAVSRGAVLVIYQPSFRNGEDHFTVNIESKNLEH